MEHEFTDRESLFAIAKQRGYTRSQLQDCRMYCGSCGAEFSAFVSGITHWPDCEGEWHQILFVKQDASGHWQELAGANRLLGFARGVMAFTAGH